MHTLFCPLWLVQYEDYRENHFPFKIMQVSSSIGFQLLLDATVDGVHTDYFMNKFLEYYISVFDNHHIVFLKLSFYKILYRYV